MYRHLLREKIGTVDDIPPLPAMATKIISACLDENANHKALAELVKHDLALTGKVLNLVNSPHYALTSPINDLTHATSLLGKNTIRNLVLSVCLYNTFTPEGKEQEARMVAFWQHSLACAIVAEVLATRVEYPQPEEAFIGGLLHDIGKLVIFARFPEEFAIFLGELQRLNHSSRRSADPLQLENKILGLGHHQLGKWAAERWQFPEKIVNAIWLHHQPLTAGSRREDWLPAIIRFADNFSNIHHLGANYFINQEIGYTCSSRHVHNFNLLQKFFKLSPDDIDQFLSLTMDRLGEFSDLLQLVDNQQYFSAIKKANRELGRLHLAQEQTLDELRLKNRVLQGIKKLENEISQFATPTELCRVILRITVKTFNSDLALCFLKNGEEQQPVGLGYANQQFFHPQDWLRRPGDGEMDPGFSRSQKKTLNSLEKLLLAPDILLASEKIVPLMPRSSLLAIPLIYRCGESSGPVGQLILDCRQTIRQGTGKESLLLALNVFATSIANNIYKVMLCDHLNRRSEEMTELCRQNEQMREELYLSQRLATVGRLAAGAAHEINNPLAVISANAQLLLQKAKEEKGSSKEREQYETIVEQTEKIAKIIQDLMNYAHPARPRTLSADVHQMVDQAVKAVSHREAFRKITLEKQLPDRLPPVQVDAMQIGQVLINLLINAEQAMPEGGKITISGHQEDGMVALAVSDNGSGIPPEQLHAIFDPFFTTREAGEGTGLGLAISHSLMEQNNGQIAVDSQVGKGTTFTLYLPLASEPGDSNPVSEALQQAAPGTETNAAAVPRTGSLLFVGPDPKLAMVITEALADRKIEVASCTSAQEAITTIKNRLFDLLLIDLDLGIRESRQLIRWLEKFFSNFPVVVLAGPEGQSRTQEKLGPVTVVNKPFQVEVLVARLQEILSRPGTD